MEINSVVYIAPIIEPDRCNKAVESMFEYAKKPTVISNHIAGYKNMYRLSIDLGVHMWHHSLLIPMVRYEKGDTVTIVEFKANEFNRASGPMERHIGDKYTVFDTDGDMYTLVEDNEKWMWHISLLKKIEINNKITDRPEYWPKHYVPISE